MSPPKALDLSSASAHRRGMRWTLTPASCLSQRLMALDPANSPSILTSPPKAPVKYLEGLCGELRDGRAWQKQMLPADWRLPFQCETAGFSRSQHFPIDFMVPGSIWPKMKPRRSKVSLAALGLLGPKSRANLWGSWSIGP